MTKNLEKLKKEFKEMDTYYNILAGVKDGWYVTKKGIKYRFRHKEKDCLGITIFYVFLREKTDEIVYFNENQLKQFIDFIPDKKKEDVEKKELNIQIPEGYEIDKEKSTFEKIIFKKRDTKPRSWEEYCSNLREGFYYGLRGAKRYCCYGKQSCEDMKDLFLDRNLPDAFIAMMQLMSLRQAWVGNWELDWCTYVNKYCIICEKGEIIIDYFQTISSPLSFPTKEMAEDFLNTFKDLIEQAKILL